METYPLANGRCRGIRSRNSLSMFILNLRLKPRIRGHPRRCKTLSRELVLVNEEVSFDHNGLGGWAEDESPRLIKAEVCGGGLQSEGMF